MKPYQFWALAAIISFAPYSTKEHATFTAGLWIILAIIHGIAHIFEIWGSKK